MKEEIFNKIVNRKQDGHYFFKNAALTAAISNYEARIVSLRVPDKNNQKVVVVPSFSSIDDYLKASSVYHGAIIGRVAERILNGIFDLEGKTYLLPTNCGSNHLQSGVNGFHNQVWAVKLWLTPPSHCPICSSMEKWAIPGFIDRGNAYCKV